MERKTQVHAEAGQQQILITREFDLPLELLFKAYEIPELLEQWMGTRVVQLENKKQGAWEFETKDPSGQVVFRAFGSIHTFEPNRRIVRTFEMENAAFEPQLEFLEFEAISAEKSRLNMLIIYRSVALRDQQLQLPFAYGINMAHDRLQELGSSWKV